MRAKKTFYIYICTYNQLGCFFFPSSEYDRYDLTGRNRVTFPRKMKGIEIYDLMYKPYVVI